MHMCNESTKLKVITFRASKHKEPLVKTLLVATTVYSQNISSKITHYSYTVDNKWEKRNYVQVSKHVIEAEYHMSITWVSHECHMSVVRCFANVGDLITHLNYVAIAAIVTNSYVKCKLIQIQLHMYLLQLYYWM